MRFLIDGGDLAYGEAAGVVLDVCVKPMPKLCTLVAYYPDAVPAQLGAGYPPSLDVMVHFAGARQLKAPKFKVYSYPEAEVDLEEYDKVAAGLAWSRTLAAVRRGFGIEVDLEEVWEEHVAREFSVLGPGFGVRRFWELMNIHGQSSLLIRTLMRQWRRWSQNRMSIISRL